MFLSTGPPLHEVLCPDWIKWAGIPENVFFSFYCMLRPCMCVYGVYVCCPFGLLLQLNRSLAPDQVPPSPVPVAVFD